jgi:hyperosmotically inducible periplasmic protein
MRTKDSWKIKVGIALLALGMLGIGVPRANAAAAESVVSNSAQHADLATQVGHQLAMVPWYGVFDDLGYSVNGTQVTLTGNVVNPGTKSDAVGYVKHIKGVTSVVDNIKLLPPSSMDFRIRRAEYHSIFGYAGLYRYAMGANPSIHIIVDNGHVTLVGYVSNEGDLKMANLRANAVPGVFSVTNNLQIAATQAR